MPPKRNRREPWDYDRAPCKRVRGCANLVRGMPGGAARPEIGNEALNAPDTPYLEALIREQATRTPSGCRSQLRRKRPGWRHRRVEKQGARLFELGHQLGHLSRCRPVDSVDQTLITASSAFRCLAISA